MIYEIRQYTDDEGKLVTARITMDPDTNLPDMRGAKYFGTYTVPHPQRGGVRVEFEFPEGWVLSKCLEQFKEEAEKHFNMMKEEAQKEAQAKLWTPPGSQGNLIVPK